MDSAKAKKAVKKSSARKASAQEKEMAALQMNAALEAAGQGVIDPELQAAAPAMQPADGYVTPYHRMGAMPPTAYAEYNQVMAPNISGVINPVA